MPGERTIGKVLENHRITVLRGALVEPTRFKSDLEVYGINLGPEDPIGVVDSKTIQGELERLNISPKYARQASRAIIGELRGGQSPRIFPSTLVVLEQGRIGDELFYRRSDLDNNAAHKRLGAYQLLLEAESERLKQEAQDAETEKTAELALPSTGGLRIVAAFSRQQFFDRVEELKKLNLAEDKKVTVDPIALEAPQETELVSRTLFSSDLRAIMSTGIPAERFDELIACTRDALIPRLEGTEQFAQNAAGYIMEIARDKLKKPGRNLDIPVYALKDNGYALQIALEDLNGDPNIKVGKDNDDKKNSAKLPPNLPRMLINCWVSRYQPDVIGAVLDNVKHSNAQLGSLAEALLLGDDPKTQLNSLRINGSLETPDGVVEKTALEAALKPLILPDTMIAQAIFADVIGAVYPYANLLKGEDHEMARFSLSYLAKQFTLKEIKALLAPQTRQAIPQSDIDKLIRQILAKNLEIEAESLTGKRKALEKQKSQLESRLSSAEKQNASIIPVANVVEVAVRKRIPVDPPNPDDYILGEESLGYQQAIERHNHKKTTNPEAVQPDPDDFVEGEDSSGFNRAMDLYELFKTVTFEGWITDWRMNRSAKGIMERSGKAIVNSLLGPGIVDRVVAGSIENVPDFADKIKAAARSLPDLLKPGILTPTEELRRLLHSPTKKK